MPVIPADGLYEQEGQVFEVTCSLRLGWAPQNPVSKQKAIKLSSFLCLNKSELRRSLCLSWAGTQGLALLWVQREFSETVQRTAWGKQAGIACGMFLTLCRSEKRARTCRSQASPQSSIRNHNEISESMPHTLHPWSL